MSTVRREAFGGDERTPDGVDRDNERGVLLGRPNRRHSDWHFKADATAAKHELAGDERRRAMARSWDRFDLRLTEDETSSGLVLGGGFETPPQE